jgi:hypothetical protein
MHSILKLKSKDKVTTLKTTRGKKDIVYREKQK